MKRINVLNPHALKLQLVTDVPDFHCNDVRWLEAHLEMVHRLKDQLETVQQDVQQRIHELESAL